ncbi:MAG: MFS transporter [Verrucomicrobiota bacterium]
MGLDPNFPFAPRRWPLFYGWTILVVSTIGVLASIPGQTMMMGVFADSFMEAGGLTRTELSDAYLVGTTCSGLIVSYAGRLFDRLGARAFFTGASFVFGLAVAGMSQIDRLAWWVSDNIGLGDLARVAVFAVGFFCIRFMGQGAVTIGARSMLAKWWDRKRGLVISVSGLAVGAGFSIAPVILRTEVELFGWRGAWWVNGLLLASLMPLMGYLFFRDNPEECGLRMDGPHAHAPKERRILDMIVVRDFTRAEALRTYSFWVFAVGMAVQALYATSYTFHVADIARDNGIEEERIYRFFYYALFFSIPTNLVCGYAIEFIRLRYVLVTLGVGGAVMGAGILMLPSMTGQMLLVAGMGVSWGTYPILTSVSFARYFGRTHLGAIGGTAMTFMVLASALGPALFARSKATFGGYDEVVWGMVVTYAALVLAASFASNPQRRLLAEQGIEGP